MWRLRKVLNITKAPADESRLGALLMLAGGAFNRMAQIDCWLRRIAGVVFIVAGIYYCLVHLVR